MFVNKKLIVIIHGYASKYSPDSWLSDMKDVILRKGSDEYVVTIVDWSAGAHYQNYQMARANTRVVASIISAFLIQLNILHSMQYEDIHLIGHSLGAHICGYTAKNITKVTGRKIGWVTGLDPAGPCFFDNEG
ncbi:pancreatic lipase-related protein 2-like protein [Leptotrombidium deliense]|uniref:Pancreatic lipase-related protein 2-like protein n=1 Tax=Leptotrombidium deliense TaxID=299467 RepID=A0A443S5E7_9ACAR|nr:pancreatic lipase-related protein 2-like protein [Leptotrombidium deliense]